MQRGDTTLNSPHRPRKRFGQHFLTSPETIDRIVGAVDPAADDVMIEIGPGLGAITSPLAERVAELHLIEFDRDLASRLRRQYAARGNVVVHEADALTFDFGVIAPRLRIVGNLPYNISTPLLFHLVEFSRSISDAHFMLQKEVVDRIAARPGNKRYGRLTVMLGCSLENEKLFEVPPAAFDPPPKVTSAVVRLQPLPAGSLEIDDPALFKSVVARAFSMRRKTLRNALRGMAADSDMLAADIEPSDRPEQVPVGNWVALSNRLAAASRAVN